MSEYVTAGALLKCTCGMAPSQFQVTSQTFYTIQGKLAATTNDKAPMTNIMPFGTCKMKPTLTGFLPCIPAPTVWTGFLASVEIGSGNALVDSSTIQCAAGGCISFQNSGQMKPNKMVTNPSSPQITALEKAAMEPKMFVEECEKREEKKEPKILRIYWMDEQDGEPREVSELMAGQQVTMYIEVEDGAIGETLDIIIEAPEGKMFKEGGTQKQYSGVLIEVDNVAYIDDFCIEYKN
jgi:hypothetical protein